MLSTIDYTEATTYIVYVRLLLCSTLDTGHDGVENGARNSDEEILIAVVKGSTRSTHNRRCLWVVGYVDYVPSGTAEAHQRMYVPVQPRRPGEMKYQQPKSHVTAVLMCDR